MSFPKSPLMCQPPSLSPGDGGLGAASKQNSAAIHPSWCRPSVQPRPFISPTLLPTPASLLQSLLLSVCLSLCVSPPPHAPQLEPPPLCLILGRILRGHVGHAPACRQDTSPLAQQGRGSSGSPPSKRKGLLMILLYNVDNPCSRKFFLLSSSRI